MTEPARDRPRGVFYTATTLDGFIADEHDSLDWLFKQDQDEAGPLNYGDFIEGVGAIAMGSTTYMWVRDRLGTGVEGLGDSWPYTQPSYVFTHRDLPGLEGADLRFVQGPVEDHWASLADAAGDRDVWVVGGGDLAAQFAEAGHLASVITYIAPVTLGAGRPLFPRRFDLRLAEAHQNKAFIAARYDVVGPLP
jgi:dihydrofolate reductase